MGLELSAFDLTRDAGDNLFLRPNVGFKHLFKKNVALDINPGALGLIEAAQPDSPAQPPTP